MVLDVKEDFSEVTVFGGLLFSSAAVEIAVAQIAAVAADAVTSSFHYF